MEDQFDDDEVTETIPEEVLTADDDDLFSLLPIKSKERYETEFNLFEAWMRKKQMNEISETVLMEYFNDQSKIYQCSSLWSKYSMVKKMLLIKKDMNISSYFNLTSFLKNNSIGHEAKKAIVLSKENVIKFVAEAPDDIYLMIKVALLFGIYGACRREELAMMSIDDIEDRGSVIIVTIPKTRTNRKRVFTIVDDDAVSGLVLYKKYILLRPRNVNHRRFFLQYKKNTCSVLPVGKNTFGAIPKTIAKFLQLPNPERYTGHTFRRTSATLSVDSCADINCVKKIKRWKSTRATQGHLKNSIGMEENTNISSPAVETVEALNLNFQIKKSSERVSVEGKISRSSEHFMFLKRLCCICLHHEKQLQCLLEGDCENKTYYSKLTSSIPEMEISELNDHGMICGECSNELETVHRFREKCLRSRKRLFDHISQLHLSNHTAHASSESPNITRHAHDNLKYPEDNKSELVFEQNEFTATDSCELRDEPVSPKDTSKFKPENRNKDLLVSPSEEIETIYLPIKKEIEDIENVETFEEPIVEAGTSNTEAYSATGSDMSFTNSRVIKEEMHVKSEHAHDSEYEEDEPDDTDINNIDNMDERILSEDVEPTKEVENEKLNVCDLCGRAFPHNSSLIAHKKTHYMKLQRKNLSEKDIHPYLYKNKQGIEKKSYKCNQCDKTFTAKCSVVIHQRVHTGEKPYVCDECNKAFSEECNLIVHKRTHSGDRPYVCDTCGMAFSYQSSIIRHTRIHTGERPFTCNICGKAFTHQNTLNRHKLIHSGEKPFKCAQCDKAFSNHSYLIEHQRTHSGEKPHKCDVCNKGFTNYSNLKKHKLIHGKVKTDIEGGDNLTEDTV